MTPFDAVALLAMLQAFYPDVGPAALARARRDRPDYFAAGTIIGTSGDALRLPDGRIFDLIFDVNNPFGLSRWQAIEDTGGGPEIDDPFRLEPGPIVPIDLTAFPAPAPMPVFVPLVAGLLGELGASDVLLEGAASLMATHSSPAPLTSAFEHHISTAEGRLRDEQYALDRADPSDVMAASAGQSHAVDVQAGAYDAPPPVEFDSGTVPELLPPDQPSLPPALD